MSKKKTESHVNGIRICSFLCSAAHHAMSLSRTTQHHSVEIISAACHGQLTRVQIYINNKIYSFCAYKCVWRCLRFKHSFVNKDLANQVVSRAQKKTDAKRRMKVQSGSVSQMSKKTRNSAYTIMYSNVRPSECLQFRS